jgi:hypothetical protein
MLGQSLIEEVLLLMSLQTRDLTLMSTHQGMMQTTL